MIVPEPAVFDGHVTVAVDDEPQAALIVHPQVAPINIVIGGRGENAAVGDIVRVRRGVARPFHL